MFHAVRLRWFLCIVVLLTAAGAGCSRDPNVLKQNSSSRAIKISTKASTLMP
jgi:hypothetical protein